MTAVMRAAGVPGERVLRVGVVRDGRMLEERVITGDALTVGPGEHADLVLPARDLARRHRLLQRRGGNWRLIPAPGMRGRIAASDGVVDLADDPSPHELESDARGKLILGATTLLFQLVAAPPVRPRPQLPLSVMRRESGDWGTTIIAALSFLLHFGIMGVLFSDWVDPVADQGVVVNGLVDSMRALPAPPVVETPGKIASTAPTPEKPTPAPTHGHGQRGKPSDHAGTRGHTSDADAARLKHQLDEMAMKTLGALASNGPATSDVLKGSEVPTNALDVAAKSTAGVGDGDPLHVGTSGAPIRPGENGSLADIGNGHAADHSDTGKAQHVNAPKPSTQVWTKETVGTVDNAMRVVMGMRPGFHACYRRELENNPDAHGKVQLTLRIGAGGEVDAVTATHSGNLSSHVIGCMVHRARLAQFDPPSEGSAVISVPVSLVLNR
jgi:hypothetical protein